MYKRQFETVFESDPYIEVGADGNDKETLMAQGVSAAMYEKQLLAWVFLSQALQSIVDSRPGVEGRQLAAGGQARIVSSDHCELTTYLSDNFSAR